MKKLMICSMFCILALHAYGQVATQPAPLPRMDSLTSEDYLRKSKKQKSTALVLLGIGTTAIAGGLLISSSNTDEVESIFSSVFIGIPLIIGGLVVDLISIPVFRASARNKKQAIEAATSLKVEPLPPLAEGTSKQTDTLVLFPTVYFPDLRMERTQADFY